MGNNRTVILIMINSIVDFQIYYTHDYIYLKMKRYNNILIADIHIGNFLFSITIFFMEGGAGEKYIYRR